MKLLLLLSISLFLSLPTFGQKTNGRKYFKPFLGHLHKNPSKDSTSLTTIQCSHSVKVVEEKDVVKGWVKVSVGEDKGYIQEVHLSSKRPDCLQGKYPKFYNKLELDITEMYFWGRLYDHYNSVKTRVN